MVLPYSSLLHRSVHSPALPGGPCDLPCLPHLACVHVKCQLSRGISPWAVAPTGLDQNCCTGPAWNSCQSFKHHLCTSTTFLQNAEPVAFTYTFFILNHKEALRDKGAVPGMVIETTRQFARLSSELVSRLFSSSVSRADQARLWWNRKCSLVSRWHWQQRCHMQTQEKSIRLWSVSQVLPVIRFEIMFSFFSQL